jgi:hypothetical protein
LTRLYNAQCGAQFQACARDPPLIISRLALLATQPPIQCVLRGSLPKGTAAGDVKLTTHLHLVPGSKMRAAIPLIPQYDKLTFTPEILLLKLLCLLTEKASEQLPTPSSSKYQLHDYKTLVSFFNHNTIWP